MPFKEIIKINTCPKDTNKNVQNETNNFELLIEQILIKYGFTKNEIFNTEELKKLVSGEKHNLNFNDLKDNEIIVNNGILIKASKTQLYPDDVVVSYKNIMIEIYICYIVISNKFCNWII